MKIRDSLYEFPGFSGTSVAHLRAYRHEGSVVAVVGEVSDNPSTSVTNRAEVIVIEHYPPPQPGELPTAVWCSVTDGGDPRHPGWRDLSGEDVEMLVGEPVQTWRPEDYTRPVLLASGTTPA